MRLPWPFRRGSPDGVQRAPSESASGDLAASGSGALSGRANGEWRRMPAMTETIGPPPLVAPNRPFAAALAANDARSPILAPLSHGRSLDAPRGLVSGIARAAAPIGGPALPAPVQRSPLGSGRRGAMSEVDDAGMDEMSASSVEAPAPAALSTAPAELASAPGRRLAPVIATPEARAAYTTAAAPPRAAPLVGLVGQARAAGTSAAVAVPSGAVQRSPAVSPAETSAPPLVAPTAAPTAARTSERHVDPASTGGQLAGAPRLTIGQARRLGLGAPVAGGPVTAATSAFVGHAAPAALREGSRPTPRVGADAAPAGVQRAPERDAPDMPLASKPADRSDDADDHLAPVPAFGTAPTTPPQAPTAAVAATPVAAATSRPAIAPGRIVAAAAALQTTVERAPITIAQRSPTKPDASGSTAARTRVMSAGGPVTVHRDGQASQLSAALDARSFTHGSEIYLPASHGPLSSGTGKALLAHELTHVGQQRRLGSAIPPEDTSHGKRLEAEAVAAERSPDLTLALPHSNESASSTASPSTAVGGASDATAGPPRGTQRAPTGDSGSKQREAGSGGSSGKGHTHSEQELEVLAHQLYHRIGRHLRRELLVDRERVGFALDLP